MTFFLMSAVYGTCVSVNAPKVGGFGVGLALVFLILGGGTLTGAAMNPARALGPAIAAGNWTAHIVYWIGPIAGAFIAALLWDKFLLRGETR
jgi:glycerol uptake facilitator-like aquaporin